MKIPRTLAVMTLPGAVLFPGAMLPLYVFEARYRRMLADVLAGDRMFAIGLHRVVDEEAEVCAVGGCGLVRACVTRPDGTSRLVLQGMERVRFREWLSGNPYPLAEVEPLPSECSTPLLAESLRANVRLLCEDLLTNDIRALAQLLDSADDPAEFSDLVGASFVNDSTMRQSLLEETDATRRLEMLLTHLATRNTSN
jgi:Lon protease-like protein